MTGNSLVLQGEKPLVRSQVSGDFRYVSDVVRIAFPIRAARTYLNRHIGNQVDYRLVEARRGETVGYVREAEIHPHSGGNPIRIRAVRTLPDGTPAGYFAPDELVEIQSRIEVEGGGPVPALRARDRIVLCVPVRSYLRFLPGIYRENSPTTRRDIARVSEREHRQWGAQDLASTTRTTSQNSDQFERFMLMFQHIMTTVTDKIDQIPNLTNPLMADPKFLPWISSWVSFELDGSLPLHQQRELVRRSIRLHRTRGTRDGVAEMIQVLTSAPVHISEREKPWACVLGAMTLAGGRTVEERFLRKEPTAHYILRPDRKKTTFFIIYLENQERFQERFGERAAAVLRRIAQIVTQEKPAQVTFTIRFDENVDSV